MNIKLPFRAMKPIAVVVAVFGLSGHGSALAQEGKRLIHERDLPEIAAPGFRLPLDATWSAAKGTWTPKDGVLVAVELPEDKHVAVLHHLVGLESAVITCDFRFDGPGSFLIGCDGQKHVGRVSIGSGGMDIAEDSVKPSHAIASLKTPVAAGAWHHLRVEWEGDRMAASLDGREIRGQHPFLATPKTRSWLAVAKTAKIRELKISGVKTPPKQ
jgi:hypothetical protein